ncbi:TerC family protein [Ectobacillus antri]|jgi:YjbE family integral membrane protein|uniref:TerC family protein n=1 Tax=Ectobacillus antri TaxID=2486280 RepID=A0ABT6H5C1_9BACI|nr:TerC family protein [Ectobacillus antri]MDG4656777.1 TerC family protein [Ectobacillus antri]MDG5753860.1 TerC family protein [Ectobacillus antri]
MELFSAEFFTALLSIIIIDLVLAGDNAIVIGLAARNLPKDQQKKVIIWGTVGAIVIRAVATLAVVWLLKIPGLLLVGGILLVWIAYKLLVDEKEHNVQSGNSMWAAIRTIIIADALMGLDNVLAVAGAAHGSFLLVVLGLLISIPIVVWGSTIILKFVDRYPIIITFGAAVLAWTATKMIVKEPFVATYFANPVIKYGFEIIVVAAVVILGTMKKKKQINHHEEQPIQKQHSS